MIKFLGSKNKKPEKMPKLGKGMVPTNKVKELSNKGFSEPEIIDILRKEGFSSEEIDSGLTQAVRIGVTGEAGEYMTRLPTLQELQMQPQPIQQSMPFIMQESGPPPQVPEPSMQLQQTYYPQADYNTEELVEAIVQERMGELNQKLTEFRGKYSNLERKMLDLHNQLSVISKSKSESEHVILSKIDSFGSTITEMNGRLSGLEKAFKEALPALIESVRALTDLVGRFKREA